MFWHKSPVLSFIPLMTNVCGCSAWVGSTPPQEFQADLKSYLNLPLQQISFVWPWAQEWEGVCYIQS